MPTCCVCHGYYPICESVETFRPERRPASESKFSPPPALPLNREAKALPAPSERIECPRCGSDNQNWEKARRGEFGDLLNRMTTRGLLALTPILLEVTIFLFMGAGSLVGLEFRKSEILFAMFTTILSIVLAWLCFARRFRAREDFWLRSVAPAMPFNIFRIVPWAPVVSVVVTMIWVMLYYAAGYLSADEAAQFPWSSISSTRMILFILYILLGSLAPYVMLATARRYVDSFDLPQPIFLNLPLMRQVVINEYFARLPEDNSVPTTLDSREISRTPQGDLSMTISWKGGDKTIKVYLRCNPWAHLLEAKEEKDKPY
jgi:hypothetical protein